MKARRTIHALVALTVAVTTALAIGAPNADASATATVHTGGPNLNVRSGPSTSYQVIGSRANGSSVSIDCYTSGQAIKGPYGTETAWDHLTSGGYVADALVYTGSNNPVVPVCGSTPSGSSETFPVAFTGGIGVYPRASTSMNSAKVGAALAEGAQVTVVCETTGDAVTDTANYTVNIWDQMPNGTWIANAYLYTGVNGRTPGVPDCAATTPLPPSQPSAPSITPCLFAFKWTSPMNLIVDYPNAHTYYGNAWQAVQNWNSVNVGVHMTISKGVVPGANITIEDGDFGNVGWAGKTLIPTSWMNAANPSSGAYMGVPPASVAIAHPKKITVDLDNPLMNTLNDAHKTYAITHELGHAIGLAHSDQCTSGPSIMKKGDSGVAKRTDIHIDSYDVTEARMWYGRS